MSSHKFELELVQAPDDLPRFGIEYQQELRTYKNQFDPHLQRSFNMDSVEGGGGPIGLFLFSSAPDLFRAAGLIAAGYFTAKVGRKVRLKGKDFEVEAHSPEEIEALLRVMREHDALVSASPPESPAREPLRDAPSGSGTL